MDDYPLGNFDAQVSLDPRIPTVYSDPLYGLSFAVVSRESRKQLDERWVAPGVYVLLGRHGQGNHEDGNPLGKHEWSVYVGQAADRGLKQRISEHARNKPNWDLAVLMRRNVDGWFNPAHIAWLERALYTCFQEMPNVKVDNQNTPSGDKSMSDANSHTLALILDQMLACLALMGFRKESNSENQRKNEKESVILSPTTKIKKNTVNVKYDAWQRSANLLNPTVKALEGIDDAISRDNGRMSQIWGGLKQGETPAIMVSMGRSANVNAVRNIIEIIETLRGTKLRLSPSMRKITISATRQILKDPRLSDLARDWLTRLLTDMSGSANGNAKSRVKISKKKDTSKTVKAKSKSKSKPKEKHSEDQITWIEAALLSMPADGTPMKVGEVTKAILTKGLRKQGEAKTPEATLWVALSDEAKSETPRVIAHGRGLFSLIV